MRKLGGVTHVWPVTASPEVAGARLRDYFRTCNDALVSVGFDGASFELRRHLEHPAGWFSLQTTYLMGWIEVLQDVTTIKWRPQLRFFRVLVLLLEILVGLLILAPTLYFLSTYGWLWLAIAVFIGVGIVVVGWRAVRTIFRPDPHLVSHLHSALLPLLRAEPID